MTGQQYYDGATVYDTSGDKIGTLQAYDPQGGYLVVQKGLFFPKDLYIPESAVQNTDADGSVYVNLYKDDLQDDRYSSPPVNGAMSGRINDGATGVVSTDRVGRIAATDTSRSTVQAGDTIDVPVREEELVVGKTQQEQGRAHLHKDVIQEQQTVSVPLRHEEVTIERVPVTGQANQDDLEDAFQEQTFDVPVMGEEAVVSKRAHVVEEVRVHKDVVEEQDTVTDTVRKERVTVDGVDDGQARRRNKR